jgi:hypothetical protein
MRLLCDATTSTPGLLCDAAAGLLCDAAATGLLCDAAAGLLCDAAALVRSGRSGG